MTAQELYGLDVETLVQEEDTQLLTEPIIAPVKVKKFQLGGEGEEALPPTVYDKTFMLEMMESTARVRNVAVAGQLHHGKTSLLDVLVASSHPEMRIPEGGMPLYADKLLLERDRSISLKCKPLSLLLPTSRGTSMVLNCMDTPGHMDFGDEAAAALRLADGVILVVDAVEGVMCQTEEIIRSALSLGLPMIVVINKMERLFLELKLPPADAYYKLRHVVEEINTCIANNNGEESMYVSPERGNVLFASTLSGWIFSLASFAAITARRLYGKKHKVDLEAFSRRLWGDVYFDPEQGTFRTNPSEGANKRTFIAFVLEPLYKLYGSVLGDEREELSKVLATLNIRLRDAEYGLNTKTVLRVVTGLFFGDSVAALMDSIVDKIGDPQESAFSRLVRTLGGPYTSESFSAAQKCSAEGPLIAFAAKTYPRGDGSSFEVLVRVFSGRLVVGGTVRILGENFGVSGDEDSAVAQINGLAIGCGRYSVPVRAVPAGSLALVSGIDASFSKTATLVDVALSPGPAVFRPLSVRNRALMKVAIEPVTPSELPKMLDGLRKISKTYPLLTTKVEDSGEHTVMGTGELYLDCALHDLRRVYADIDVKVSDPVARFAETVTEMSYLKCFAATPNHKNKLTMIAEPLERSVTEALEAGRLPCPRDGPEHAKELARILREDFGWDILAARSVWGFGPDERCGPNILLDDTLPSEVDKQRLEEVRDLVLQGFQWACREGPLCEEAVRGVRFRLIDATIASDAVHRGAGQIIPTARRVCYSAMLTAAPRLMEPMLSVEIQTRNEWVEAVYAVLAKRRGHVTQDIPKAGTPLYMIRALLPLMDSFGFETDLRIHTHGMAYSQSRFDHWQVVPGDPLDRSIKLIPLEPSPAPHLARDFLLKTRRRKGLGEDVAVGKFFDAEMLEELAREEAISGIQGLQL